MMHKLTGLVQAVALVLLVGIIGAGVAPMLPQGGTSDEIVDSTDTTENNLINENKEDIRKKMKILGKQ